jgi:hypothetical protein
VFYFEVEVDVLFHVASSFYVHVDVVGVGPFAGFYAWLAGFAGECAGGVGGGDGGLLASTILHPLPSMLQFTRLFFRLRNIIKLIISLASTDLLTILSTLRLTITIRATSMTLHIILYASRR